MTLSRLGDFRLTRAWTLINIKGYYISRNDTLRMILSSLETLTTSLSATFSLHVSRVVSSKPTPLSRSGASDALYLPFHNRVFPKQNFITHTPTTPRRCTISVINPEDENEFFPF